MCGIALEMLRESGKIPSFDAPLRQYFPEWARDPRGSITLREVMDQASGLDASQESFIGVLGDVVKQGLSLKRVTKPGATWAYNDAATALLSGVIRRASGMTPEHLLQRDLFVGLGIRDFFWTADTDGNSPCHAGLAMHGTDVLRIGQMLVGDRQAPRGFDARRFLATVGFEQAPGRPDYGLLWWKAHAVEITVLDDATIKAWRGARMPDSYVQRLLPIRGQEFKKGYTAEIEKRLGREDEAAFANYIKYHDLSFGSHRASGPVIFIEARGAGGQYMILFPAEHAVVVRLSDDGPAPDPFVDLPELAQSILLPSGEAAPARGN